MIADYEIALARASDAAGIATLSRDAIEHGLTWSWTPGRVLRNMRDAATNTLVARERQSVAGFAIMKYGDDRAHLLLMAVHSTKRRRGIGSALLDWLEVTVRTAGMESIRIEARDTNTAARKFYARHGYRQSQHLRGYYQGLDDAVVLHKILRVPA
ncbi:MAG: GNAT family N-acetyltransferase [Burkholderiaceae bacterium]